MTQVARASGSIDREVLQPRFERYFESNRQAFGASLRFEIGCGLDDGDIYAVKVGIRGTNDVAWNFSRWSPLILLRMSPLSPSKRNGR